MADLRKQIEYKTQLRDRTTGEIDKLQKVDEMHIEIDVLQNTPQGIRELQERYYKLLQ